MTELTVEELVDQLNAGSRAILQVRHGERPKMSPDDVTFGEAIALTGEGVRTARLLGRKLAAFRGSARYLASPLRRTRMTAALIAEGRGEAASEVDVEPRLGNDSFYFADRQLVRRAFAAEGFFTVCERYFERGEEPGFRSLKTATDELEAFLRARWTAPLLIAATHDCYVAGFISARTRGEIVRKATWTRFLDGGALIERPDGTRTYALVRAGLSEGICGVESR